MNNYSKDTRIIRISEVKTSNIITYETDLIRLFKKKFELFKGNEYFYGEEKDIILCFDNFIKFCFINDYVGKNCEKVCENEENDGENEDDDGDDDSDDDGDDEDSDEEDDKNGDDDGEIVKTNIIHSRMEYKCNKCNKKFSKKSNLDHHINRKRPCNVSTTNDSIKCKYCNMLINHSRNINRHLKSCKEHKKQKKYLNNNF